MPFFQSFEAERGGFPKELWRVLQVIGGFERPLYSGGTWKVDGVPRGSYCKLTIFARERDETARPIHVFIRRFSYDTAVQEAAKIGLQRVFHDYAFELRDTVFRLHPAVQERLQPRAMDGVCATAVHLAGIVEAQEELAKRSAQELETAYEALRVVERMIQKTRDRAAREIRELKEALENAEAIADLVVQEAEDAEGGEAEEEEEEEDPEERVWEPEEPAEGHQDRFAPMPAHPPEHVPGQPQPGWLSD